MGKTLTRSELYELIWSHPRTSLAKDFGISDVAIGKHCARLNIPGPPPGYWARKKFGKAVSRPLLPLRLPGHPSQITLGASERHGYWHPKEDLDLPLNPPVFSEAIEDQVAAALKRIGCVSACRDLTQPNHALLKVLAAEGKRREKCASRDWSWDKPYFDDPRHQRQLRLFNSVANALSPVTERIDVYVHDDWFQGLGTLHFLKCRLDFGSSALELEFGEPDDARAQRRVKGFRAVAETTLRVGYEGGPLGILEWRDEPDRKLERQLEEITAALLPRAEVVLRTNAQLTFERRVERRAEKRRQLEAAEHAREVKRLEAAAAQRRKIRQQIIDLAEQRRKAMDIREMVSALLAHPDLDCEQSQVFEEWRAQALKVADELDPVTRPVRDFILAISRNEPNGDYAS